jgi:hypothetical protein
MRAGGLMAVAAAMGLLGGVVTGDAFRAPVMPRSGRAHIQGEPRKPGQRRNRSERKFLIGWCKVRE